MKALSSENRTNSRFSPLTRNSIILAIFFIILAVVPFAGLSYSWIQIIFTFFIFLAVSQLWNLLAGYAGLVSLGQPVFIGLATYVVAIMLWAEVPLPLLVIIIIGGIAALVFAALISTAVFRLGGLYFAIGTLIIPEILKFFFNTWSPDPAGRVGGGAGFAIRIPSMSLTDFYYVGLIVAVIVTFITLFILHSKFGLGIKAIRDQVTAAAAYGVDVFKMKFRLFLLTSFLTGLSGIAYYFFVGHIEPVSAYGVNWTMNMIIPAVLGGMGTFLGPFIGTAIFTAMYFLLAGFPAIHLIVKGIIVVVVLITIPGGIVDVISRGKRADKKKSAQVSEAKA